MRHIPHLYLPGAWHPPELILSGSHVRHLSRVLRLADGSEVTYTDGAGRRVVAGFGESGSSGVTSRSRRP